MIPRFPRRYEVQSIVRGPTGEYAWHCTCSGAEYGPLWLMVGHWFVHLYRWALGRCFYCGDPECED